MSVHAAIAIAATPIRSTVVWASPSAQIAIAPLPPHLPSRRHENVALASDASDGFAADNNGGGTGAAPVVAVGIDDNYVGADKGWSSQPTNKTNSCEKI